MPPPPPAAVAVADEEEDDDDDAEEEEESPAEDLGVEHPEAETAAATDAAEEMVTEGAERAITVASKALGRSFSLGVVTRMCLANLMTSTTSSGG